MTSISEDHDHEYKADTTTSNTVFTVRLWIEIVDCSVVIKSAGPDDLRDKPRKERDGEAIGSGLYVFMISLFDRGSKYISHSPCIHHRALMSTSK